MFKHNLIPKYEIESLDTVKGRYYRIPETDIWVPSVTTVISQYEDKAWLEEWKANVGEEKAKRKQTQAGIRGTAVHNLFEKYLLNDPDWKKGVMPANLASFLSIKDKLDKNIETVFGVELPLWSMFYHTAGRTDAVVKWADKMSIFDLKTSKHIKKEEDIEGYFIQATCYAMMFQEIYGIKIEQIVIGMMIDFEKPRIFIKNADEYYGKVQKMFRDNKRISQLEQITV